MLIDSAFLAAQYTNDIDYHGTINMKLNEQGKVNK